MPTEKRRSWIYLLLFFLLLLQVLTAVYYGYRKEGLFGDELWTYILANNYYEPFLGNMDKYLNVWITEPGFWGNKMTAVPEHLFAYDSVLYNLSCDVHPPLYFLLFHTVCSFFPGQFSKWFGLVPNLLFFVMAQLALFRLSVKLLRKPSLGLAVCLFYGFAWGTINNVVYIRAYVLLTVFAILAFASHLDLEERFTPVRLGLALLISLAGFLTQYYFLVYQFFVSAGFCAWLLRERRYRQTLAYSVAYLLDLVAVWLLFPAVVGQLSGKIGYQAANAYRNLVATSLGERMIIFGKILGRDVFGLHKDALLILLAVVCFALLIRKFWGRIKALSPARREEGIRFPPWTGRGKPRPSISIAPGEAGLSLGYMALVAAAYFVVILKVAPYYATRYIVIIEPWVCVLFIFILDRVCQSFRMSWKGFFFALCLLVALSAHKMYSVHNLFVYDHWYPQTMTVIAQEKGNIGFVLFKSEKDTGWWKVVWNLLYLRSVRYSYVTQEGNLDKAAEILQDYGKIHDKVLVYRSYDCRLPRNEFANRVSALTDFKHWRILNPGGTGGEIFCFEK